MERFISKMRPIASLFKGTYDVLVNGMKLLRHENLKQRTLISLPNYQRLRAMVRDFEFQLGRNRRTAHLLFRRT